MGRGNTASKLLLISIVCVCLCVCASWYMLSKILEKAKEITTDLNAVSEDINEIATALPTIDPTREPDVKKKK